MGRPEKPIGAAGGAVAMFAAELRALRADAGNPTYRDMARATFVSSSSLSTASSGYRLPTLPVVLAFVTACGGDTETWRHRWLMASRGTYTDRKNVAAAVVHADPPAQGGLPRPAQLPMRPRRFVGRTVETGQVLAPSTTPVVISGPVGVGKSGFALHCAHQAAVTAVDGQLYADLGMSASACPDAATVVAGFLVALGVPAGQLPDTADQRTGLYRSLLSQRRIVVVLDNVRDERQVRPLLAETRGGVTIVVARTPLLGLRDVRRLRLDVLPRADSIAMIAAAVPDRVAADPLGCDLLADQCGDLPLALDIAARKLDSRPDIPLHRITERLRQPTARLDWLRVGDVSVWDALDSAYAGISEPAKRLLHQLIAPSARSTAIADLCGRCPADELVAELADAGMVRFGHRPGTYRLDSLARAFVAERAVPAVNDIPCQPSGHELIVPAGQFSRSNRTLA